MGYSYDLSGRLACDACGGCGTTRKRTCPYRVTYAEGGSLPYCSPAALCTACYAKHKATLHATCKAGVDASNARERERAAKLAAGELEIKTAWGSWHATVPEGFVGVRFVNGSTEVYRLVDADEYRQRAGGEWLSGYPVTREWENPS